jgi:hypothetical protein
MVIDSEREIYGVSDPVLEMCWWTVKRRTPCGARLVGGKFVNLNANKKWACNTQNEALESFIAKKARQIRILSNNLARAESDMAIAIAELDRI